MRWPAVFAVSLADAAFDLQRGDWTIDPGPGDGIAGAMLSPRYIPHAVDPAQGTLITANADPVGATFDGRPPSPHGRDLLDRFHLTDPLFDAPSSIDDIVAAGESRWVFH
jgi:hypothetical protein